MEFKQFLNNMRDPHDPLSEKIDIDLRFCMNDDEYSKLFFAEKKEHITLTKLLINSLDLKEKQKLLLDLEKDILEEI